MMIVRKIAVNSVFILIFGLLISACNKDNGINPPLQNDTGYFPNGDGTRYKYSVTKTDSAGTQNTGTRNIEYSGTAVKNGNTYQVQIDSLNFSAVSELSLSYFRKTNDILYYFLDTTGISSIIPDSQKDYISLDKEMKVLSFPVTVNKSWSVLTFPLSIFSLISPS
jgi:hypothetical protein